jgi:hypothetical protein
MTRAWLLAGWLASSACGNVPTSPSSAASSHPDSLQLQAGPQWLSLIGLGISSDPEFPPCTPLLVPYGGTGVVTAVVLAHEAEEWVARSTTPTVGDIGLRFQDAGRSLIGEAVSGTIRGSGIDMPYNSLHQAVDVRASLAGAGTPTAQVTGDAALTASFVSGRIAGLIRFSDSHGAFSTCSAIQWSLVPNQTLP